MLVNKLVTLIVPCYNSEEYINNFLNSLLRQTYKNIQIIMVNDGSTDKTLDILNKRKKEFKEFNEFLIIDSENLGAAGAVNKALKYVNGEYLCWADSDDMLDEDNVLKKYEFLKNNQDFAMVCCNAEAIEYGTNKKMYDLEIKDKKSNIFYNLIYPGVPCYPGVFMIRTKALFNKIKNREIPYDRHVGQNWQLLLPVAYDGKCGYINECLYEYYIRSNSHSHKINNENIEITMEKQKEILFETIKFIPNEEQAKVRSFIENEYALKESNIAFKRNEKEKFNIAYRKIEKKKLNIVIKKIIINIKLFNKIYRKMKEKR